MAKTANPIEQVVEQQDMIYALLSDAHKRTSELAYANARIRGLERTVDQLKAHLSNALAAKTDPKVAEKEKTSVARSAKKNANGAEKRAT